jgi:O-antigen/teichoic acid export membrane protein
MLQSLKQAEASSRRIGQILQSLGAVGVIQLCLVVSGIITARTLGPAGRGDMAVILALPGVVMQLVCVGSPSALTFFVARHRKSWDLIARRAVPAALVQVVVGVLVLFALDTYFLADRAGSAFNAGLIVILSLPLLIFQYYTVHIIQGLGDIKWFNVLRIGSVGVYSLAVVGASLVGLTVLRCALLWVGSQILVTAVAAFHLWRLRRRLRASSEAGDRTDAIPSSRTIRRFALSGFLGQISPIESLRLDTLVVAALFPARIVGYYSVANSVTNMPLFAADALSAVGYPHVAEEDGDQALASTKRYMKLAWLLCGSTAVASAVVIPVVIPLLFGAAYKPATGTAELLACAAAVLGLRRLGNDFLRALGSPGLSTKVELVTLTAFAMSLVFLGPVGDGRGVAAALIVSAGVGLAMFGRLLRRRELIKPSTDVVGTDG